jgi:hypothetical protein
MNLKPSFLKTTLSLILAAPLGFFYVAFVGFNVEDPLFAEASAISGLVAYGLIYLIWSFLELTQ